MSKELTEQGLLVLVDEAAIARLRAFTNSDRTKVLDYRDLFELQDRVSNPERTPLFGYPNV